MTRLIDADVVIKHIEEYWEMVVKLGKPSRGMTAVIQNIKTIINSLPTVDAEPVRHGKWADDAMGVLRCSECNAQAPWRFVGIMYDEVDYRWKANYCPQCGARMDEE